jgi:hypothetical protein
VIPTRVHAAIDWVAVVGVELMGRCGLFSRRVQDLLKSSARVHAVYAAATDYELGAGVLPVPAHLALDTAIGTGLIGAGLAMRGEPGPVRALLVGMGLTELALVSLTDRAPSRPSGLPPGRRNARQA